VHPVLCGAAVSTIQHGTSRRKRMCSSSCECCRLYTR
jgi:hypothetical protein